MSGRATPPGCKIDIPDDALSVQQLKIKLGVTAKKLKDWSESGWLEMKYGWVTHKVWCPDREIYRWWFTKIENDPSVGRETAA